MNGGEACGRGTSSTPQGVRRGWGRNAWQALHLFDTTWGAQGVGPQRVAGVAGSQRVAGVALSRHRMGSAGGEIASRARVAKLGKRGSFSTPHVGWRRYPRPGRKACQAWRSLNTRGGAQRVGSLSAPGSQSVVCVALSRHHRGCAGGGVAFRARVAKCGRRGIFSTPQGVRWGWGRYSLRARKAWQAWHFLDTTGGVLGLGALSVSGSQSVAGVARPRHQEG